jgi:N-acetylglucosamine-6-phosphate deacetylase
MTLLAGADLVLPDRVLLSGTLVIDDGRIVAIQTTPVADSSRVDLSNHFILPGFIDVHVHGVDGTDAMDGADAIRRMAARLPRYGVTAFCPTTIACVPDALGAVLDATRVARRDPVSGHARVLAAHLESNFINPEYRGAQPLRCLCLPPDEARQPGSAGDVNPAQILERIESSSGDVAIVTLASELPRGIDLVRRLVTSGIRVSLGHSGATFDQAMEGIKAGATHATHLFNRMPPVHHREPGLAGAVLASDDIAAELICDGVHVHPGMLRVAIESKTPHRIMAITDGTAAAGLATGSKVRLGEHTIVARDGAAYLDDGTLAGSVQTMDRVLKLLVERVGIELVDVARMCATTPAAEMGLAGLGLIQVGAAADLTVLNRRLEVVQTYVGGERVFVREPYRS